MSVSIDYLKRQAETLEHNRAVSLELADKLLADAIEIRDSIGVLERHEAGEDAIPRAVRTTPRFV